MKKVIKTKVALFFAPLIVGVATFLFSLSALAELSKKVQSEEDWERVYSLLKAVESGGDTTAVGDKHLTNMAYGVIQIRKPYLVDALEWAHKHESNQYADTLVWWDNHLGGLKAEHLAEINPAVSYAVFRCYMARWTKTKCDGLPSYETVIRMHNGGGPGFGKDRWVSATEQHVSKVRLRILLGS